MSYVCSSGAAVKGFFIAEQRRVLMDASKLIEPLRKAIDEQWHCQIEWLQRLVRFESVKGREQACQEWLAHEFSSRSWIVDRYSLADVAIQDFPGYAPMSDLDRAHAQQVVATVPTAEARTAGMRDSGRSLILQGHVDVVPTGPEDMWADWPFSGTVRENWLYGRGSQDMKMGISAIVFALDAIRNAGLRLKGPAYVQTVTEEESTGNGALSTIARGYRADACLIPEPTGNKITRAQTGAIWFKLKLRKKPIHVESMPDSGNAITKMLFLLSALQSLAERLNREALQDPWFGGIRDPIKFNPGVIHGGDWPSSTPSWCEADCRIGLLPQSSVAEIQSSITAAVMDAAKSDPFFSDSPPEIIWNGFCARGCVLTPGSEAEAILASAHFSVFGSAMPERISTAVNDTRYYNLYQGIPALCYGPSGEGLHGVDERADLASLKNTTLVLAMFIANWCGVESAPA